MNRTGYILESRRYKLLIAACALIPACVGQNMADHATDQIVSRMVQVELAQEKNLQHYRMIRTYTLNNADGSKPVELLAQVVFDGESGKSIQVIEERGSDGMFRRALHKVLEAEIRTSNKDGKKEARITPDNYSFHLNGTEMRDGRRCFVLQLTPKRKSKYLVDGRAWVDAEDYALVGLEGRSAASVSFWVGKPYITQSYEKIGDFWLMASNHSVADAKFVGRIALTIETRDVEMGGTKVVLAHRHHASAANIVLD